MKKLLSLSALPLLIACASMRTEGTNFDAYIQKYGFPKSQYTLKNGNTLYSYKNRCEDKKNWEEYNVEVKPDNIIVQKTYIKTCPITNNTTKVQYTEKELLQQKYNSLYTQYSDTLISKSKAQSEWFNSYKTKGINHPDTLALETKRNDLTNKASTLKKELEELKKQL